MTLEAYIMAGIERAGLNGLTLWRTREGWQAAARRDGSDGFSVSTGKDPVDALKASIVAWNFGAFPERAGFGSDGPLGNEFKRLIAATARLMRALAAFEPATPEPEDEEL